MATKIPAFTYSGTYRTEMIGDRWYIFFLTSGTLKMSYGRYGDVYLHGGGGAGGGSANPGGGGGGGGGWFATHTDVRIEGGQAYSIVVGAGGTYVTKNGGASSAFGYSVQGGAGGGYADYSGGVGVGGSGGSGSGGTGGGWTGGSGSSGGSNTTYAFDDSSLGLLYGGGGAGGAPKQGGDGSGGAPYGAEGSKSAAANTGAGGGGANYTDEDGYGTMGSGGSGIVILRSTQDDELPVKFDGRTLRQMRFNGEEVKHLIFGGKQLFMETLGRWAAWSAQKMRLPQPAH